MSLIRGSGKGGAGASIAEDMYFASTAERDQFTIDNPSRIFQGVTCAVENASAYDYFQYDMANTQWRDANLIFQGPKGNQGEAVSVGDGTGTYVQVNKINFDEGLAVDVTGDVATVITQDPASLNVKSVDGVEPDIDGNVQIDALRGRIKVTNVDAATLSAGDGISIEGALADGGYSVVKHSNGLTLNGFCLDSDIVPGEEGNMFISGECACIELGLNPNTPKGAKIYYDRLTAKLYTKLDGDGDNFYVGNFTDTSENVFVDASLMNSQYQSKLNYEDAINQLVNVIIPDEGKDFDSKLVFSSDAKKEEGYSTGYWEIVFEYNDKLQTEVAKAPSPYEAGQANTQCYASVFSFDSTSFWQYFYLVVTDEQLLKMQTSGQDIGYEIGKLEYGMDFGNSTIGMGKRGGITPNPTYGGKINCEGYVIPNRSPDDINVIIDPNDSNNTYYLNNSGDVVEKSQARSVSYNKYQLVNLTSLRNQQFGYSMRRGYLYKDKANNNELQFIPSSDSNYFVIAAGQHRVGYPGIAQSTTFIDWKDAKIFDSSIAASANARYRSEASNYSNVLTYSNDGNEYVAVDKTYPAECVGDVKLGHVVQMVAPLTVAGVPAVKEVSSGTIISGVALSDGSDQDVIMILEKGTYDNDVVAVLPQAVAGDIVYVDSDGALSLEEFENTPIGYIMESKNVFIDNDLYNAKFANYVKPSPSSVDIVFWWTENAEPTAYDITNALGQIQTDEIMSHTDNFKIDDLQKRTMTARRDENAFKYAYFAWPKGFFNPEPTKIETGWGSPSTWIDTEVSVNGVEYKVLTVEVENNVKEIEDYGLVQEGIR